MNKLASDKEVAAFREWLTDLLKREDMVEIQFVKADGTDRVIKCTLKEDKLPPRVVKEDSDAPAKPAKAPNPNNISVFDLEASAWRSFKIDSIKHLHLSLVEEV